MKTSGKSLCLCAIGAVALGCGASRESEPMQPAAYHAPEVQRDVNVRVTHGDRVHVVDDALVVQDRMGHSFLMLFDGDAACEDAAEGAGVPRGLILQAELDANGEPVSWTFYRDDTVKPLSIGARQANYRSGPGGGSVAIRTTLDQLPLEVRGSYQPEYCE